jgi:hypothetical protein
MKDITLTADTALLEEARLLAERRGTTLDEEFRSWPAAYVERGARAKRAMAAIDELSARIKLQGPFSRDELNER